MRPWRVGNHQPQNLYRGEEYMGVMFNPEVARFIVEAMNADLSSAPEDQDVEERADHTAGSMIREIEHALTRAGLGILNVHIRLSATTIYPDATILTSDPDRNYTTAESTRLADSLGPGSTYHEHGEPGKRIGVLHGETQSGFRFAIHCEPRMTAEEVAQEFQDLKVLRLTDGSS